MIRFKSSHGGVRPFLGWENGRFIVGYTSEATGKTYSNDHTRAVKVAGAVGAAAASVGAVAAATALGAPAAVAAGAVAGARALVSVDGYYREDGTYVRGHNRTPPDDTEYNNFS